MSEQLITPPAADDTAHHADIEGWHDVASRYKDWHPGLHPHVEGQLAARGIHVLDTAPDKNEDRPLSIEETANFQGNWTELQTTRTKSLSFIEKLERLAELSPSPASKVRLQEYPARHTEMTSTVGYMPARQFHDDVSPKALGGTAYNENRFALFSDAEWHGKALTDRQKDIIAAHEMYHSLFPYQSVNEARDLVQNAFDDQAILDYNEKMWAAGKPDDRVSYQYAISASELTARMAQLKNYFGMCDDEQFTLEHLEYARVHYIEDTGLDNYMTVFFMMTDKEPQKVVGLMNTLPI